MVTRFHFDTKSGNNAIFIALKGRLFLALQAINPASLDCDVSILMQNPPQTWAVWENSQEGERRRWRRCFTNVRISYAHKLTAPPRRQSKTCECRLASTNIMHSAWCSFGAELRWQRPHLKSRAVVSRCEKIGDKKRLAPSTGTWRRSPTSPCHLASFGQGEKANCSHGNSPDLLSLSVRRWKYIWANQRLIFMTAWAGGKAAHVNHSLPCSRSPVREVYCTHARVRLTERRICISKAEFPVGYCRLHGETTGSESVSYKEIISEIISKMKRTDCLACAY